MLAKKEPLASAVSAFGGEVALLGSFLDAKYVQDNAVKLQQAFSDAIEGTLGDASLSDLESVFGDANGNIDEAKLTAILEDMEKTDPAMFKDSNGNPIKPSDIVAAIRAGFDGGVRQPSKVADALKKIADALAKEDYKLPAGINALDQAAAYKSGLLHIVSSLLLGGVTIARGIQTGGKPTPEQIAGLVAVTAGTLGLATEGFSKAGIQYGWGAPKPGDALLHPKSKEHSRHAKRRGKPNGKMRRTSARRSAATPMSGPGSSASSAGRRRSRKVTWRTA